MTQQFMSVREMIEAREAQDFGDLLYQQAKNAPWIGLSVLLHLGICGILLLFPPDGSGDDDSAKRIEMTQADAPPDLEEEPEVEEQKPIEEEEKVLQDPVIKDAKISDHNETDDDSEFEEDLESPFNSDAPFEGPGTNGTIGIGGGAGGRFGRGRGGKRNLKAGGGGRRTQTAVDLALEWLKNHQSGDGKWEAEHFSNHCKLNKCDGPGEAVYDPGVSGLALLCFLGYGETHQSGHYKNVVKKGLKYLKNIQDSEGCFGPQTSAHFMYNHACAALAMTEAYGMTGSRLFKEPAQRGVNFVHKAQNPYLAWRYGVRDGDNDTSVTGWMTMVLKSATLSELDVDKSSFKGTEPEFGRVGYQNRGGQSSRTNEMMDRFPADQTESLTAVALTARIFAGQNPETNEMILKGADLIVKKLPRWDEDAGTIDMYYWYYATLALFQVGGDHWKKWNESMKDSIVDNQRVEQGRDERGSWDPVGPWAPEGGRVYSTSLLCLCLEVYYRYGKVFGTR
jgi:hypothetical protein